MASVIDYALMAGNAYRTTRDQINWFPVPQGWTPFFPVPDSTTAATFPTSSGFEAVSFTNGSEIVISYAGTYDQDYFGDIPADIGLATGGGSVQLTQAVDYYLQVKAANPGATITLTGHSLGGGLASLVAVFFGVPAYTFNQAPFANSAQDPSILASLNPLNYLFGAPDIAANLRQYLQGKTLVSGSPEAAARDSMLQQLDGFLTQRQTNGGIPNSNLVTDINVEGEFLSCAPATLYDRIGVQVNIPDSANGVAGTELHAQSLLTAFLQSNQTAAANKGLNDVTFKLQDLLKMIFDRNLFAHYTDPNTREVNFLEHLVRHQTGGVDGVQAGGDAMVTRFTSDLWKLARDGGLTLSENPTYYNWNNVSKALIAFAMQFYYEENDPGTKGVSITLLSEPPCHVAHALN